MSKQPSNPSVARQASADWQSATLEPTHFKLKQMGKSLTEELLLLLLALLCAKKLTATAAAADATGVLWHSPTVSARLDTMAASTSS
jgi:hypothetical protein